MVSLMDSILHKFAFLILVINRLDNENEEMIVAVNAIYAIA